MDLQAVLNFATQESAGARLTLSDNIRTVLAGVSVSTCSAWI